ncbi:GNAT family N-acetyltransferase [Metabacillus niabensis]|uniref:Ribosomal protein S18 acetylase RimI-like enzyme n=1 Tax=Metabacillus niabensis TaxID=324854 RepID=A0ABT9Z0K3_9BACI|nr:GNAT family N-acetyltransferase [Metabacillus niabensis]MDQ0225790.1 ribosomal protein S18 acetylase RimI-like enzyme [Metabacillus niabensis]
MIRFATQKDGKEIATLLWEIFEDMELSLLKKISKDKLIEMVAEAVCDPTYRYGFKRGLIYELNGEIAGIIFGYPAADELIIDEPFKKVLIKYGYDPNEKLFVDREAFPNEWYIDSIVVNQKYRGMGIGSILLEEMGRIAIEKGYRTIGLNVDIANPKAKKLYSRLGYKKVANTVISGHQYEHMCKS